MNLVIGFDPGFGNGKAAVSNGTVKSVAIPNVVGIGSVDSGMLDDSLGISNINRPNLVSFEGVTYLVGEHVADYARVIERMDFQRLADAPELKALFYTTLYRLLGSGSHSANIVVGLPVEVMSDRQLALSIQRDLRSWMEGSHEVKINHNALEIKIERVGVLAQPAGSYFNWGMNPEGQWTRPTESLREMVAVCDIGFNTADLYVLQKGSVVNRYTTGDTAGMRRAAEIVTSDIRQKYGVTLSLHEVDALLRDKPEISTASGLIDLSPLAEQARQAVASAVLSLTERAWGNARQFRHVLFTGGGADALRDQLTRQYPHGVVLKDAVTANACGLAKYGQRVLLR